MTKPISPEVLAHYGVLGMKWGVRKDGKPQGYQYGEKGAPKTIRTPKKATQTTRNTINDYNKMNNLKFEQKHGVSKRSYAKRVNKHGDPYKRKTNRSAYSKKDYTDAIGKNKPQGRIRSMIDGEKRSAALDKKYERQKTLDARKKIDSGTYHPGRVRAEYKQNVYDKGRKHALAITSAKDNQRRIDSINATKSLSKGEWFIKTQYELLTDREFKYTGKDSFDQAKLAGLSILGISVAKIGMAYLQNRPNTTKPYNRPANPDDNLPSYTQTSDPFKQVKRY